MNALADKIDTLLPQPQCIATWPADAIVGRLKRAGTQKKH